MHLAVEQFEAMVLRELIHQGNFLDKALPQNKLVRISQSVPISRIGGCSVVERLLVDQDNQILV